MNHRLFMGMAFTVAKLSPDPNKKVGCILTNANNEIIGGGYNRLPPGVTMPDNREEKNSVMEHAEIMLINTASLHNGSVLYLTHCPCETCAIALLETEIKDIFIPASTYESDMMGSWKSSITNAQYILKKNGVNVHILMEE